MGSKNSITKIFNSNKLLHSQQMDLRNVHFYVYSVESHTVSGRYDTMHTNIGTPIGTKIDFLMY